jgi:uncharacterized protein (TIGR02217 family)
MFLETPRFPTFTTRTPQGGPMFSTEVAELSGGNESRNGAWNLPRHRFEVDLQNRSEVEFEAVKSLFLIARGRLHGFRFRDQTDCSATATVGLLGTGVGSGVAAYQMYKRYTAGSNTFDRKILKPVSGSISVFKNGTPQTIVVSAPGAGQCTVDTTTGIVTFGGSAPTGVDVLTWSGDFDVPVRFDLDAMQARAVRTYAAKSLMSWDSIALIELRNPS